MAWPRPIDGALNFREALMSDLRVEEPEQQMPYAAPVWEPIVTHSDLSQLRSIVLWLSKQPWPQDDNLTWEGLVMAHEKAMNPDPLPELPSRAYRVGK